MLVIIHITGFQKLILQEINYFKYETFFDTIKYFVMKDIDNNYQIDIVEGEPVKSVPNHESFSGWRNSVRWEWNGSSFTRIQ